MYAKLFSSILDSSLWAADPPTRVLFITMLAMADRKGYVYASESGLARRALLDPAACASALTKLMSPDQDSLDRKRNPDADGRRVEETRTGWRLLNYEYYRDLQDADERRYQDAARKRHGRSRSVTKCPPSPPSESPSEAESTQGKESGGRVAPTIDEVRAHWAKAALAGTPEAFFGWQEEHHWPSKSWKRAAGNWSGKENGRPRKASRGEQHPAGYYDDAGKAGR